jgi:hypothetical protein
MKVCQIQQHLVRHLVETMQILVLHRDLVKACVLKFTSTTVAVVGTDLLGPPNAIWPDKDPGPDVVSPDIKFFEAGIIMYILTSAGPVDLLKSTSGNSMFG